MTAAAVVNRLWRAAAWRDLHTFRVACEDPTAAQQRILLRLVRTNAKTWFGRRHGFRRIASVPDFQAAVPVSTYQDHEEAIDRIRAGETEVLTAEPVLRLVPTSGTGSARKRIPYTRSLVSEFDRAVSAWISNLFHEVPAAFDGRAYWAISPPFESGAAGPQAVPEGFGEDHEYLGGVGRLLSRIVLTDGSGVRRATDVRGFRFATLRALVSCEDLSLVSVWHPSFLLLLLEGLRESIDELGNVLPRQRARLRHAASVPGTRMASVLWPRLALVSCWLDGPSAPDGARLRTLLPHAAFQAKGLLATEGVVTLPFGLTGLGIPALTSHFLEFLGEDGDVVLIDALRPGRSYEVLLTTGGGLYRYRLGDRVSVAGKEGRLPLLSFLGRAGVVSDYFGEKLDEGLIRSLVGDLLVRLGLDPVLWFLSFEPELGRYVLFLEASPDRNFLAVAEEVDATLSRAFHYALARRLGQLAEARVFRLTPGTRESFYDRLWQSGMRPGEAKPACLSRQGNWMGSLDGAFVGREPTVGRPAGPAG